MSRQSRSLCPACGQPIADHTMGPPDPPRIKGHLGATEDKPGGCLTRTGYHEHAKDGSA